MFSKVVELGGRTFIFLAIVVPHAVLAVAFGIDSITLLNYVHIMCGMLWTGIDLFMGFIVGPILGQLAPERKAEVFRLLIPKMTFLMPVLAGVTIITGFMMAQRMGMLSLTQPLVAAALAITVVLVVQGFGFLLPNEVRIFRQLISEKPDGDRIAKLGMQNARLAGIQGLFQLAIILVMANLRF
ncbi:MAG: hypothetical protein Q7S50_04595 [bacterium]|nr:hypothetical protein [bacterium]